MEVFECEPAGPEGDQRGPWLDQATGHKGAYLQGVRLRLPGHGDRGPTLEIFTYDERSTSRTRSRTEPARDMSRSMRATSPSAVAGVPARLGGRLWTPAHPADHPVLGQPVPPGEPFELFLINRVGKFPFRGWDQVQHSSPAKRRDHFVSRLSPTSH